MGFGANASSVYAAQGPGFNASQLMTAQSYGIQAGSDQQQANNDLIVANYNATEDAFQDKQQMANTAETYNAGGVMLSGSPLGMLEQDRQQAILQVNNVMSQAGLQANLENVQATQGINQGTAQLLSNQNAFTTGQTNATINQQDTADRALAAAISWILPGTSAAINSNLNATQAASTPGTFGLGSNFFGGGSANANNAPSLQTINGPIDTAAGGTANEIASGVLGSAQSADLSLADLSAASSGLGDVTDLAFLGG